MHTNNCHKTPYNFDKLVKVNSRLSEFVITKDTRDKTIDFGNSKAVLELNRALLNYHYNILDWEIPEGYLCPPIPGRADYIHHIADLLNDSTHLSPIRGLDIGVGANCIYPMLGNKIYNWHMVGSDINEVAIKSAQRNCNASNNLNKDIEIRHQQDNANIFKGIILKNEYYHFTMCNPPFHSSEKEAQKGTIRKLKNIDQDTKSSLNFGGQANELWCNGGEALFIKRMIKQSLLYKNQVKWFTCLVSKKDHLPKIHKQLNKLQATYKTINMAQGQKQSRFIAWTF